MKWELIRKHLYKLTILACLLNIHVFIGNKNIAKYIFNHKPSYFERLKDISGTKRNKKKKRKEKKEKKKGKEKEISKNYRYKSGSKRSASVS